MNTVTLYIGDVRDCMAELADNSVNCLITSPPFLALRSYLPADHADKHREIGSESTPAQFLDTLLQLTAEWRRLLTPYGSLCVELGDTYSGNDSSPGAPNPAYGEARNRERAASSAGRRNLTTGWPLPKSLCMIPELYGVALAYGINPLTGAPSPAGTMRVRNWLTWTRPNPPVGALGDKFRPATSYVTVACTSDRRWFDLDAVRTEAQQPDPAGDRSDRRTRTELALDGKGDPGHHGAHPAGAPPLDWWDDDGPTHVTVACTSKDRWFDLDAVRTESSGQTRDYVGDKQVHLGKDLGPYTAEMSAAGAPPLDWWDDNPGDQSWQPLHRLPTAPYKGAHYATFPVALPKRLIEAMCPREVCTVCGEARRRIVGDTPEYAAIKGQWKWGGDVNGKSRKANPTNPMTDGNADRITLGWTDCGCAVGEMPSLREPWRPSVVLDPFAGSGTTALAAAQCGRDAILIDLDERNVALIRHRLTDALHIDSEVRDGNRIVWTVRADLPGLKGEHPDQQSLFDEAVS